MTDQPSTPDQGSSSTYYAELAKRYEAHAETFPVGSLGRSLNQSEAAKYFNLAARLDGKRGGPARLPPRSRPDRRLNHS